MDDQVPKMPIGDLIEIPTKPYEPPNPEKVPETASPIVNDTVGWLNLMKEWFRQTIITDIITQLNGGKAMTDPKTTITGLITGVLGLLAYFGILIPEAWVPIIILIGTMVLGYFAHDKKPVA